MGAISSVWSLVGRLGGLISPAWKGRTLDAFRNWLTKNPSVSTALVPYTGGKPNGVLQYVRENKITSLFLLHEVLGAAGFSDMVSEVFGDSEEARFATEIMQQLSGSYDDPGRGKSTIDLAMMQDEFRTINSVLNFTGFSVEELIALRAVLSLKPGVFEQYLMFTEQARALRV